MPSELTQPYMLFHSLPAEGWVHIEYEEDAVIWGSRMPPEIIPKPILQSRKRGNDKEYCILFNEDEKRLTYESVADICFASQIQLDL